MDLKRQILKALYGGALVSAAASMSVACTTEEQERGNKKPWQLNKTTYTSSCLEDGMSYTELPYDGWQEDVYNGELGYEAETMIVCAPQQEVSCEPSDSMSVADVQAFMEAAFGPNDTCEPYAQVEYMTTGNICGPLVRTAEECCYRLDVSFSYCVEGRPFTVDGMARLASVEEQDGWCDEELFEVEGLERLPAGLRDEIAFKWAEAGTHEHASVASFAKFILELMQLGAPMHLVQAATTAMADEIRHARDCFKLATAYAGRPLGPGMVDMRGGLTHIEDEVAILEAAIFEACIGETLAASVAQWMAPKVSDERVRRTHERIAEEEGRHAELGWSFVQWMLQTRPELIDVAKRCFERSYEKRESDWAYGMTQEEHALLAHGCLREGVEDVLRRRAYHTIVKPCAEALFALLEGGVPVDEEEHIHRA